MKENGAKSFLYSAPGFPVHRFTEAQLLQSTSFAALSIPAMISTKAR
jgi:hypothetical protein